jgi:2,6-dihydroxypseudooxynicotine hydrolase
VSEPAKQAKSTDPRVAAAIAHWAPRFVSNGVLLADFEEVTAGIARWEDWCAAWCERAKVHEALGREALAQGYKLSAGEHLIRASMYYHFAKFVFVHDLKQMREAHLLAVGCYRDALPHMRPAGERVAIPFEGKTMYGVLRKPSVASGGSGRLPILIMAPGLDSTKEELHAYEEPFLARGIAILAIDGPGQGEAEYEIPICGDYERTAHAVCDWIEKRPELDASKIAMWGVSLGGYYAPRATAYEKRIKACIGISGPFEWKEIWKDLPDLTREAFRVRSHSKTEAEALAKAAALSMKDAAPRIACPIFIVTGRQDRLVPASHAERLAKSVAGPVELMIVEDGGHNANNRPYRYRSRTADWLAGQLGLQKA